MEFHFRNTFPNTACHTYFASLHTEKRSAAFYMNYYRTHPLLFLRKNALEGSEFYRPLQDSKTFLPRVLLFFRDHRYICREVSYRRFYACFRSACSANPNGLFSALRNASNFLRTSAPFATAGILSGSSAGKLPRTPHTQLKLSFKKFGICCLMIVVFRK